MICISVASPMATPNGLATMQQFNGWRHRLWLATPFLCIAECFAFSCRGLPKLLLVAIDVVRDSHFECRFIVNVLFHDAHQWEQAGLQPMSKPVSPLKGCRVPAQDHRVLQRPNDGTGIDLGDVGFHRASKRQGNAMKSLDVGKRQAEPRELR